MPSSPERRKLDSYTLPLIEELVASGGSARIRVSGQSMWPTLVSGDSVELGRVDTVEVGQLVLLSTDDGRPWLHRVVAVELGADGEPWVQTRGDALVSSDPWVPRSRVVARVVSVEPRAALGRWASLIQGVAVRWSATHNRS